MSATSPARELDARVWDAVVVGAGPAGALSAFEMARAGAAVLLLDRHPFPRWKVCGSCLSPGAQAVLREAGVARVLDDSRPAPLHTLRLSGWSSMADIPLGPSVALSRSVLDSALVRAAESAGVSFAAPARARMGACAADHRSLYVEHGGKAWEVRARVVIAADGVGSPLLAEALGHGPDEGVAHGARIGFGATFPPSTEHYAPGVIHMAVGPGGYVGLVRLEDGTLDVASALAPSELGGGVRPEEVVGRLLAEAGFPALAGAPAQGWRGTPRLTRRVRTRGAERLLAVGDAAGYVEPFTGEGIAWALSGARSVAPIALEGIRGWKPELVRRWDRAHEETIGAAARFCRVLTWTLRRSGLSRAGLLALSHVPELAAPFVARVGRAPSGGVAVPSRVSGSDA